MNAIDYITVDGIKIYYLYYINNDVSKYLASVGQIQAKRMPSTQKSTIDYLGKIPWHIKSIFISEINECEIYITILL